MQNYISQIASILMLSLMLTGCARDLSSNVYTSDSTMNLTLVGEIISMRLVKIKESDRLSDNAGGALGGGAMGAVLGSGVGKGTGRGAAVVGGAILGAGLGAAVQGKLGESKGYEYIIKVDNTNLKSDYYEGTAAMRSAISSATTSGLITVVQSVDAPLKEGQKVYVIFSDKRVRVIAAN